MTWIPTLLLAIAGPLTAAPPPPTPPVIGQAAGAALQADARRSVDLLRGVDPASLSEKDRLFVTCMRERFGPESATPVAAGATFADRALTIYQGYWYRELVKPEGRDAEEQRLQSELRQLLGLTGTADMDAIEDALNKRLAADGVHSLQGRTGLLRELMIWEEQDDRKVPVALPEGQYDTHVALLDGFKSFGWAYYATCGRASTGGWTTEEGLFAVVPRYESLENEEFKVTFLGHEAQHFADKSHFKGLEPWELEYRAKLTELALANETRAKVLGKFVDDQGDDPASPHSYANRAVLTTLVRRLGLGSASDLHTVELARLQAAARETLVEDSRRRSATGAAEPSRE
jgi:hypothetical protein